MDFPTSRFSLLVVTVISSRCKQTCPLQAEVLKEEVVTHHQASHLFFNTLWWKTPPVPPHQQSCSPGSIQPHFLTAPGNAPKTSTEMKPFLCNIHLKGSSHHKEIERELNSCLEATKMALYKPVIWLSQQYLIEFLSCHTYRLPQKWH